MGSLWAKFKGMKLWLKIVIIIGILTVIGMIYNAVTGVPKIETLRTQLLTAQHELLKSQDERLRAQDRIIALQDEARKTLEERARYTALFEESRAKDEELKKAGDREADLLKQMAEMRSQLEESQQAIEGIGLERDEAIAEAQSYEKSFFGFYRKSKKENR